MLPVYPYHLRGRSSPEASDLWSRLQVADCGRAVSYNCSMIFCATGMLVLLRRIDFSSASPFPRARVLPPHASCRGLSTWPKGIGRRGRAGGSSPRVCRPLDDSRMVCGPQFRAVERCLNVTRRSRALDGVQPSRGGHSPVSSAVSISKRSGRDCSARRDAPAGTPLHADRAGLHYAHAGVGRGGRHGFKPQLFRLASIGRGSVLPRVPC